MAQPGECYPPTFGNWNLGKPINQAAFQQAAFNPNQQPQFPAQVPQAPAPAQQYVLPVQQGQQQPVAPYPVQANYPQVQEAHLSYPAQQYVNAAPIQQGVQQPIQSHLRMPVPADHQQLVRYQAPIQQGQQPIAGNVQMPAIQAGQQPILPLNVPIQQGQPAAGGQAVIHYRSYQVVPATPQAQVPGALLNQGNLQTLGSQDQCYSPQQQSVPGLPSQPPVASIPYHHFDEKRWARKWSHVDKRHVRKDLLIDGVRDIWEADELYWNSLQKRIQDNQSHATPIPHALKVYQTMSDVGEHYIKRRNYNGTYRVENEKPEKLAMWLSSMAEVLLKLEQAEKNEAKRLKKEHKYDHKFKAEPGYPGTGSMAFPSYLPYKK